MVELIDAATGELLVAPLETASAGSLRAVRGLLGRDSLPPHAGLLLADPLRCIHTARMRFAIDIVFLDRELAVVGVAAHVPPWRLRWHRRGRLQLELSAGSAASLGLVAGRRLAVRHRSSPAGGGHQSAESPRLIARRGVPHHQPGKRDCVDPSPVPSVPLPGVATDEGTPPTKGAHRVRASLDHRR